MGLCTPARAQKEAWKGEFPATSAKLLPEPSGYCKFGEFKRILLQTWRVCNFVSHLPNFCVNPKILQEKVQLMHNVSNFAWC